MRDVLAELGQTGATAPNAVKGRDVLAELEALPVKGKKPSGATRSFDRSIPERLTSALRKTAATPGAIAQVGSGALSWIPGGLTTIGAMPFVGPTRAAELGNTVTEAPAKFLDENLPFQQERQEILAPINAPFEALEKYGEKRGEQTLKETGNPLYATVSATFWKGLPFVVGGALSGGKAFKQSTAYRKMTIKERALADTVVENVRADLKAGNIGAEIREQWKNPKNREALIKKYVQGETQPSGEPVSAGAPKEMKQIAGQGDVFDSILEKPIPERPNFALSNRLRADAVTNKVGRLVAPEPIKALPAGQGFTLPKETPYLPVKSEAIQMGYEPRDVLAELGEKAVEKAAEPATKTPTKITPQVRKPVPAKPSDFGVNEAIEGTPIYQAIENIKSNGGLNLESLKKDYGKEQILELVRKRPGIISQKGAAKLDEIAQEHGFESGDVLLSEILGAKSKKALTKEAKDSFMEVHGEGYALAKKGFVEADKKTTTAIDLNSGEKVKVKGKDDIFIVKEGKGGDVLIKDGETIKYDAFDQVPVTHIKKIKKNQAEIPGASFTETFSLAGSPGKLGDKPQPHIGNKTGKIFEERGSMPLDSSSEIVTAILKAKDRIKEAMPHLENLGRRLYESGKTNMVEWIKGMSQALGEVWKKFRSYAKEIFDKVSKPLKNEMGKVGYDIRKDPIIKQRRFKKGDKELEAPPVRKSELETVQTMNELRPKPLGGWFENPLRTFEELGKDAKELFYRPAKEAEHRAKTHMKQIQDKVHTIKKGLPFGSSRRIGIYAISKQKDGARILSEMGVKDVPKLTPKEMQAYEWMRRGLEIFYEKLQDARARAGKEPFGKVENYFTFFREMGLAEKMGFSPIFTRDTLLQNVMHRKTTPFGFEKSRKGGLNSVDLDAFNIFLKYMDSATRHYYLSPVIAKGREMLLSFKGKEGEPPYRLADDKPRAAMFITEWLDFVAGQRKAQLPHLVEKGLQTLNKNLAFSILSGNLRSALIQPSAMVNTLAEIGPRWSYEGIKSILDNTGVEKSNVLLSRRFDVSATDSIAGNAGRLANARTQAAKWGLTPLQWLDFQTAKATWNGAYKKGLSEKMSEREAINYADDTVTRTQGSAMPSDMAPVQRTALGKAISMFQTFVINQWGFLTKDVMGIKNASINNKMALKKVTGFVIGSTLFNMFYEDGLGINSPMPSPIRAFSEAIEEGEDIPSASAEAAKEIGSLLPVIGGGVRYGSGFMGATAEYITDAGKKIAGYKGPTKSAAELVGKGLGIPGTTQAVKMTRIAKRGGSPLDMILGRYPEKNNSNVKIRRLSE